MQVFVPSVLPKNILSPAALQYKFLQGRMSGLGCVTVDQNGNAIDDGLPCPGEGGGATGGCPYGSSLLPDGTCGYAPTGGGGSLWTYGIDPSTASSQSVTSTFQSSTGDTIVVLSNGTHVIIGPGGNVVNSSGPLPQAAQGTVSANQAAAYASLISTLTNAGVKIAAITSLPAGASLLPNGTIVGAGQNPSSFAGNPFGTLFSNPFMIVAVILGVVFIEELGR